MNKRYFKGEFEPGSADLEYIEFTDGWPSRQIDILGGEWFTSLDEPVPGSGGGLADKPLSKLGLPDEWEINADEFEEAWAEALKRRAARE